MFRASSGPQGSTAARREERGFTIPEAMISIAVLAILVGLALPGFRELAFAQGVKTASFDVLSGLILARSEAITRNAPVTVRPSGGDWANGWTISDSGGELIRSQDPNSRVLIAGPGAVTYNGAGRLTGGATSLSIQANGARAPHSRCINIDLSGRPVAKTGGCS
jgi:type IV fimbrial biogenesis protein FimT